MRLPKDLEKLLKKDINLQNQVNQVISFTTPILKRNESPLFPDFTDHGLEHIELVTQTAWSLMTDSARKLTSSGDAAILILSCILHDIAMHLSEEGFLSLINTDESWQLVPEMGDKPWRELWADFKLEARRFDERALKRLFGHTNPVPLPPEDNTNWTKDQRKLVGEFIRRQHQRLAHQIALNGFPGHCGSFSSDVSNDTTSDYTPGTNNPDQAITNNKQNIGIGFSHLEEDIADLAGLVARSHGINLRDNLPYLEKYNATRSYRNIHSVFLMAVLRIADFIQLEAERAPKQLLAIKSLSSPISQREWHTHHAIKDIRIGENDEECLYIQALPDNAETYLRLKDLLHYLQLELDTCWAVLGEIYSRYTKEKWHKFAIGLRRVKSNIDDKDALARQVNYIPMHARFKTAGASLMNLMVEPLYGANPFVAMRELMQNAIDAVNERQEYEKSIDTTLCSTKQVPNGDILITLYDDKDGDYWVKVEDNGIGMTAETLQNYFLTAGASFRNSQQWRKDYEDEAGNAKVMRSGRFGLGVFAILLLSDTVHVSTRHVSAETGISFTASLADEMLEFNKQDRPSGTTIKSKLSPETFKKLSVEAEKWCWYRLAEPKIHKKIIVLNEGLLLKTINKTKKISDEISQTQLIAEFKNEFEKDINKHSKLAVCNSTLPDDFHRIIHKEFQDIHWTYNQNFPLLSNNGVRIKGKAYYSDVEKSEYGYSNNQKAINQTLESNFLKFEMPNLSCFDLNSALPLNIQRSGLTRELPFIDNLCESIFADFVAYTLIYAPITMSGYTENLTYNLGLDYEGLNKTISHYYFFESINLDSWVTTDRGTVLAEPSLIAALNSLEIFCSFQCIQHQFYIKDSKPKINIDAGSGALNSIAIPIIVKWSSPEGLPGNGIKTLPTVLSKFDTFTVTEYFSTLTKSNDISKVKDSELARFLYNYKPTASQNLAELFSIESPYAENLPTLNDETIIFKLSRKSGDTQQQHTGLAKRWLDTLGRVTIPYDEEERRTVFKDVYKDLDVYIKKWQRRKATGE